MTILFEYMTPDQKLEHVKRCLDNAFKKFMEYEMAPLADIVDTWDYWCPWLIEEVEKLRAVANAAEKIKDVIDINGAGSVEESSECEGLSDAWEDVRSSLKAWRDKE